MRDDCYLVRQIIDLINEIENAIHEYGDDIEDFLSTPVYKAGCTMFLMQIGEYAKDLSDEFTKSHNTIDWDGLKGLRNVIAHRYEHVNYMMLWAMIIDELPQVKEVCNQYISSIENG